jgi:dihydrodipicolinate synthase/N-acetylneuraminate lyase
MSDYPRTDREVQSRLMEGMVIPAHPLALDSERRLDEVHQRALTRYYIDSGAGGIAIGVHTTQFEIRDPKHRLFEPVLKLCAETMEECEGKRGGRLVKIAGVCGKTAQALGEAEYAASLGYDLGLISLGAFPDSPVDDLIEHCEKVARVIPLFGFYLQPSVGGRPLSIEFWRRFVEIENVAAIKVAPFSRYGTTDVARAVAESDKEDEVALYTGNDDNIIADLLTTYRFKTGGESVPVRIVGGLLGQWAVWTKRAVDLLGEAHRAVESGLISSRLLSFGAELTDANSAIFDVQNGYAGCISGIHEVLRGQGLLKGRWCLNPMEDLSPGQLDNIRRICESYVDLNDDKFVAKHLDEWLME